MKKSFKIIAVVMVATLSLGCLSAYAVERMGKCPSKRIESRMKDKSFDVEELKADLAQKLSAGEITQEEYDEKIAQIESGEFKPEDMGNRGPKGEKPEMAEMTDEEKAAKLEELKADLAQKLSAGEITQEEYDEKIAQIESGEFKPQGMGGRKPEDNKGDRGFNGKKGREAKQSR